MSS
ncbi:unnamed protein product [Linum tenue]|jgi:aurora kinase